MDQISTAMNGEPSKAAYSLDWNPAVLDTIPDDKRPKREKC